MGSSLRFPLRVLWFFRLTYPLHLDRASFVVASTPSGGRWLLLRDVPSAALSCGYSLVDGLSRLASIVRTWLAYLIPGPFDKAPWAVHPQTSRSSAAHQTDTQLIG